MLRFRKAAPGDLEAISALIGEARAFMATLGIDQWQDGYPQPHVLAQDIQNGTCYVMEEDGQVAAVGVLIFGPDPFYQKLDTQSPSGGAGWLTKGSTYGALHRFAASDRFRHQGAAGLLLQNLEDVCRQQHIGSVRTDTHRGNVVMRRFLEKLGYTLCGEVSYDGFAGDPLRVAFEKLTPPTTAGN